MDNKAQSKNMLGIVLLVIVGYFALSSLGIIPKLGGTAAMPATTTTVAGGSNILQTTVSDVTAYFKGHDLWTPNTATSSEYHRVFLCTPSATQTCANFPVGYGDKGYVADGGSVKCSPGDKGIVFYGLNSTTYYPVKNTFNCPQTTGIVNDVAGLPLYDSAPSITLYRKEGDVLTSSNVEPIGANAQYGMKFSVQATSKRSFGDVAIPGNSIACAQYNATCFTQISVDGATLQGTPNFRNTPAGLVTQCYNIPAVGNDPSVSTDGEYNGVWNVQTSSINIATTDQCSNVSTFFYDNSVDLNTNTLQQIDGYQDELGNDIGQTGLNVNATHYFS